MNRPRPIAPAHLIRTAAATVVTALVLAAAPLLPGCDGSDPLLPPADLGQQQDGPGLVSDVGADGTVDSAPAPDTFSPDSLLPSCSDNVKNGGETDVDCGGAGLLQVRGEQKVPLQQRLRHQPVPGRGLHRAGLPRRDL